MTDFKYGDRVTITYGDREGAVGTVKLAWQWGVLIDVDGDPDHPAEIMGWQAKLLREEPERHLCPTCGREDSL